MKSNKPLPVIGIIVKTKLAEKNMSQRALAEKVGVNEKYLTEIIRGRKAKTGSKYLKKICDVLEIEMEDLNVAS
ncbi:MAG TPA: transcriptional regulator [Clostridiales bacterium]|nr:transcriptional regulator [Clostridiales bacterium]